ncbi:MAG: Glycerol-3-phosphate dehydrogenase [NAD(P)+] (EC [uncultured Campylobacterales bacterium]|uniref:Glycerol-3-phosphate dehydrogenase [NAD(P)+] n=1 Tax=uncultured Campylobacterales bacterium TaxID=352960 RepID=A0A6S6S1U6_9BACT|nr:MAG: Glycerol-3-phosphate dehydrogenase [NAD(P)+] (EC [uncultured Campylobacterales bacterium]
MGIAESSIGIIGAGKWGNALKFAISQNNKVLITSRTFRDTQDFVSNSDITKCEYLIYVMSSNHIGDWCEKLQLKNQKLLIASKGITTNGEFLHDIVKKYLPEKNIAYLSGPSFASEVMQSLPTAVVVNSTNKKLANTYSSFFPDFIKTYQSSDILGAEIAGAYKNVIAIASGICDGLGLGNNARAALLCRGLVEMARFGEYFGADAKTFLDLSGMGDLVLSATSVMSRNYRVGLGLAQEKSIENILKELGEIAEGIQTTKSIQLLSSKHKIYTPIVNEVFDVLNGKDPKISLKDLLS